MRSLILSLVDPVKYCLINRALPNNGIRFDGHETLNPASFPGWPSFGDLLSNTISKTLIGATFHIHEKSKLIGKRIAAKLSPDIAELKEVSPDASFGIYAEFPGSLWLEIKWSRAAPNELLSAQTCNILWYPSATPADEDCPIAMGIEDLDYVTKKEGGDDLVVPAQFPFPSMKIEFLND